MGYDSIEISWARENNLKSINLNVPKGQITIFTGVSGSGKSSIVFDTIAQEAGRQLNETFSKFVQVFMPKYRHPDVDVIRNADWVINMGVEGGSRGGEILFEGTPADLKKCKVSITARYL